MFDGFCISSAIHTHSSNTYARPERRRREDGRKKKQQLDHPPHCNSLILYFGSFMCSLSKSFLCSNLFIWIDRPIVPNGSRCYISIFDGLVFPFWEFQLFSLFLWGSRRSGQNHNINKKIVSRAPLRWNTDKGCNKYFLTSPLYLPRFTI